MMESPEGDRGGARRRLPSDPAEALDDVDAIVWEAELDAERVTYVNLRAVELLGWSQDAWCEPGFWAERLLHADDRARVLAACRAVMRSGQAADVEYRVLAADGIAHPVTDRIRPVSNSDPPCVRGVMIVVPATGVNAGSLVWERTRLQQLADRQARTLDALRMSEERFRALADSASTPIITIDQSDVIRFANAATAVTFGYELDQIVGRRLVELMPERFRDDHQRGIARYTRTGEKRVAWSGIQLTGLHSSGREIPLWVSFGTFEHRGQRFFTGILLDLSERLGAEQALRGSEAHYRRLVETSPYAVYVLDLEGRFAELNAAAEAILARRAEQLLGLPFTDVLVPQAVESIVGIFRELVDGTTGRSEFDVEITRPSGEQRLLHIAAAAIVVDGVPAGVHGIASDITDERARDAQSRMLAAALDHLPDSVALMAPDGRYFYTNEAYCDLLGFSSSERPGYVQEIIPDEPARAQMDAILAELENSGRWAGRVRRRRADGVVLDVAMLAALVPLDPPFTFTVMRDAREEIAREEHVRRVERLASLGTLIGGVAHELNNPLTAIVGFSHLMLADDRSEEDLETLRTIAREAERAARIVADLRVLARNTQEHKTRTDAVDVNDVVRHVLKVRGYTLRTRNVAVIERLADGLPPARGNRAELEQVVLNLVVNAEHALASSSHAPRLVIRTRLSPLGVVLHVVDNGPGIPREILQRVFDPFFTTKSPGEGTGLGLSLVHGIVEEHGGRLRVSSEPGNGAEFTVELPAYDADADAAAAPQRTAVDERPPPLRVLVVDDEPAVRELIDRLLRARGHSVCLAADGGEALARMEREPGAFDVVVSDMRMPGLDGDELIRQLRVLDPALARRVVLVTGDAGSIEPDTAGPEGAAEIIMKPFDVRDFVRRVEDLGAG